MDRALPASTWRLHWERFPRLLAVALVVSVSLAYALQSLTTRWNFVDLHVYLGAAQNLLSEGNPYLPSAATTLTEHYHYAPWLAAFMVPWTWLPEHVAEVLWAGTLLVASVGCLLPLRRYGAAALPLGALMAALLVGHTIGGNVHALLLAPIVWRIDRRDGPLWVALAASLKAAPIVLVAYYVGRREWIKAGVTLALTGVLVAPMLLFSIPAASLDAGAWASGLFAVSPVVWAAVAAVAALLALKLAPGRLGLPTAATAVVLAFPRMFMFDLSWLLVGTAKR